MNILYVLNIIKFSVTLFSGSSVLMDKDSRPFLNGDGFISLKKQDAWHPVCEENWTNNKKDQAANFICQYLGFGLVQQFFLYCLLYFSNNRYFQWFQFTQYRRVETE